MSISWFLWYFVVPVLLPVLGYFPGKRLGMMGDLPKGVMRQWRRWCLHPDYAVGVEGEQVRGRFAAVRSPVVSFSLSDDELMSARNIESLHAFYSGAQRTMTRIGSGKLLLDCTAVKDQSVRKPPCNRGIRAGYQASGGIDIPPYVLLRRSHFKANSL